MSHSHQFVPSLGVSMVAGRHGQRQADDRSWLRDCVGRSKSRRQAARFVVDLHAPAASPPPWRTRPEWFGRSGRSSADEELLEAGRVAVGLHALGLVRPAEAGFPPAPAAEVSIPHSRRVRGNAGEVVEHPRRSADLRSDGCEQSEGPPLANGGPSATPPDAPRKDGDCCGNTTG
jgi:hypothetical protein